MNEFPSSSIAADDPHDVIRIMILGGPNVGKDCLESRFTTGSYPPPYDPSLTISSRQVITLPPEPWPLLDTSPSSLPTSPTSSSFHPLTKPNHTWPLLPQHLPRDLPSLPPINTTASWDFGSLLGISNSSSIQVSPVPDTFTPPVSPQSDSSIPMSPSTAPSNTSRSPSIPSNPLSAISSSSYTIETINYPSLSTPTSRLRALTNPKSPIHAVLLLYDISTPSTLPHALSLASEITSLTTTARRPWFKPTISPLPILALVGTKSDLPDPPPLTCRPLHLHVPSSAINTATPNPHPMHTIIDSWLHLDRRPSSSSSPSSPSSPPLYRQIPTTTGHQAAQSISPTTPFCETSSLTGSNIHPLFTSVVRAVLANRNKPPDNYHDRPHHDRRPATAVGIVRRLSLRGSVRGRRGREGRVVVVKEEEMLTVRRRLAEEERKEELRTSGAGEDDPEVTLGRRGTVVKRMKSLFSRQQPTVTVIH